MKTNFNLSRAIFSALLALMPFLVFSNPLILTPNNLQEVLEEISNRYEDDISISMTEVQQFLAQSISGTFDANLLPPEPEITEMSDEQIAFAWPAIPQANHYITRYLNLEFGNFSEKTTVNPAANFTLDNHFFMYTFQALSPEGVGRIWIIIHDKPLSIGNDVIQDDCHCRDLVNNVGFNITDEYQTLVQVPFVQSWEKYFSIHLSFQNSLIFSNPTIESAFSVKIEGAYEEINAVNFNRKDDCTSNINSNQSNIWATDPYDNDNKKIIFSFVDGEMKFKTEDLNYTGSLVFTHCADPVPGSGGGLGNDGTVDYRTRPSGQVFPNPSSNMVALILDQWTFDLPPRLILRNATGQTLEDFQSVDGPRQDVNLSPYPNGTYYLQVISGDQSEVYPIVKIE